MWTFGRKLSVGFALSFALLLLIGLLAYRGVEVLTQNSYKVTRTHSALTDITELFSLMKDAETAQRGFLLTGDESYLDPYRQASANVPRMSTSWPGIHSETFRPACIESTTATTGSRP